MTKELSEGTADELIHIVGMAPMTKECFLNTTSSVFNVIAVRLKNIFKLTVIAMYQENFSKIPQLASLFQGFELVLLCQSHFQSLCRKCA